MKPKAEVLDTQRLDELDEKISDWGLARGIIKNSTAKDQYLKLVSEVGELGDAIAKEDEDGLVDAIGDVFVCLLMIAECEGHTVEYCVGKAWNQIKDRTGYLTPDGVFVKDDDQQ